MKRFSSLFLALDQTNKTNEKVRALASYFDEAGDQDKLWAIALFSHKRPKRTISTTLLREFASGAGNIPLWLFEESYHVVGDLAETIALILPDANDVTEHSLTYWIEQIISMDKLDIDSKKAMVLQAWDSLNREERFVYNKIITGSFRMGVSQKLMTRALSISTGLDENLLAHRLMGSWQPHNTTFDTLILTADKQDNFSQPYPFYLAYALETAPEALGEASDWQAEWKWDGIRSQLIVRNGEVFLWSRGEELITEQFPEFKSLVRILPDGVVLDGEILIRDPVNDQIRSFSDLQTRLGRKAVSAKMLKDNPAMILAYDLLEFKGQDIRQLPLEERRNLLITLIEQADSTQLLQLSAAIDLDKWESFSLVREKSREFFAEGLMLKRRSAPYLSGRKKGDWWKWKVDPYQVDAVMIYAQRGHGRRANLYTDYTFAVWDGDKLVPFTKAYSGLTDVEFAAVTRFVNQNTLEKFGPVRSVKAELVFELAFEGIQESKRHKSGIALRFPRIKRWRKDKPASEANTLEDLRQLLTV